MTILDEGICSEVQWSDPIQVPFIIIMGTLNTQDLPQQVVVRIDTSGLFIMIEGVFQEIDPIHPVRIFISQMDSFAEEIMHLISVCRISSMAGTVRCFPKNTEIYSGKSELALQYARCIVQLLPPEHRNIAKSLLEQ